MCRRLILASSLLAFFCTAPVLAQGVIEPGECEESTIEETQARIKICVPEAGWNGQLLVFVHGYVPNVPGVFPLGFFDTLPGGVKLSDLAQGLGFAYASTTYRQNGLAILEGIDDVRDLMTAFEATGRQAIRSYLVGGSEGSLVATLLVERFPDLFDGAYATCGPIGSFRHEINYLADFRVLFDYFFHGVFEGTAVASTQEDILTWLNPAGRTKVLEALKQNPSKALELLRTARAAFDPTRFESVLETAEHVLAYTVLGANDLRAKLGGNPYDNRFRWYSGSSNDLRLNLSVKRFAADAPALLALRGYETSGALQVPVVSLHTTADDVVPFTQELLYLLKVRPTERGRFIPLPVIRYGHCAFTTNELLTGLGVLVIQP